jgi:hypothetical protein
VSSKAGRLGVIGGLIDISFKGRRRGDEGGARTEKDAWRVRHTSAEAARRAIIIFAERLADEVTTRHEVGG